MKIDEILLGETKFTSTATLSSDGSHYKDFGIHKVVASLYGKDPMDIVEVEFVISSNQTPVEKNSVQKNDKPDYWVWICKEGDIAQRMIWPQYFLLNMCFPYGIKAEEERGNGKAFRVELVELDWESLRGKGLDNKLDKW